MSRAEVWRQRVREWEASGESARVYAERTGLSASMLYWWRRELERRGEEVAAAGPRVARLVVTSGRAVVAEGAASREGDGIAIEAGGLVLRLPGGLAGAALVATLRAVREAWQ